MKSRSAKWASIACACSSIIAPPAFGQGVATAPTLEQLQAQVERRDAIISDLLQRVQSLEQRLGPPAGASAQPGAPPIAPRARTEPQEAADEALLERALERSLVLSGGAVLARGQREIEPSIADDFTQSSGLAAFGAGVVTRMFRRETLTAGLGLRAGLPWDSQVDIALPYAHQHVESVVEGVPRNSADSGIAGVQAALTHQFVNNRDARLAVLGSIAWLHSRDSASLRPLAAGLPDFAAPASVGAGHDALTARIAASKRPAPLVFVGSVSHAWNRADDVDGVRVKVGDADGLSIRAILAARPDVSLRAGFSFTRTGKSRVNGVPLEGTRATASLFEPGTSVVLNRNMLLDVYVGFGLTAESPDFQLGVSIPIRF